MIQLKQKKLFVELDMFGMKPFSVVQVDSAKAAAKQSRLLLLKMH